MHIKHHSPKTPQIHTITLTNQLQANLVASLTGNRHLPRRRRPNNRHILLWTDRQRAQRTGSHQLARHRVSPTLATTSNDKGLITPPKLLSHP